MGGLYGILVLIGSQIVAVFNAFVGSNLERFLAAQLFYFEKNGFSILQNKPPLDIVKDQLLRRKPADFGLFQKLTCCSKKRRILQLKQANEKASRELDLVRFLQQQMLSHITRKV